MASMARTVCGDVDPARLGQTLMHEHLHVDYSPNFKCGDLPADAGITGTAEEDFWERDMAPTDAGHCRCFFSQSKDNMVMTVNDHNFGWWPISRARVPGSFRAPKMLPLAVSGWRNRKSGTQTEGD